MTILILREYDIYYRKVMHVSKSSKEIMICIVSNTLLYTEYNAIRLIFIPSYVISLKVSPFLILYNVFECFAIHDVCFFKLSD